MKLDPAGLGNTICLHIYYRAGTELSTYS